MPPQRADDLVTLARRLADRLRALPLTRLAAPVPGWPSRARAGHAAAQALADLAAGAEGAAAPGAPAWRDVPWLGDAPVGDQVAVLAGEAGRALAALDADVLVWTRDGQCPARERVAATLDVVRRIKDAVG